MLRGLHSKSSQNRDTWGWRMASMYAHLHLCFGNESALSFPRRRVIGIQYFPISTPWNAQRITLIEMKWRAAILLQTKDVAKEKQDNGQCWINEGPLVQIQYQLDQWILRSVPSPLPIHWDPDDDQLLLDCKSRVDCNVSNEEVFTGLVFTH